MLKHIGRHQQHQPAVHMRTPSNGSMMDHRAGNEMGYPAASPVSRPAITRPINTSSLNSPTHSASPTAINQTKTTLASNLDDSLAAFHHQHNGPLSSSLFERSVVHQQVPNGHTSYLSSSGGLTLNNNKSVAISNGGGHIRRGSHPGLLSGQPQTMGAASISGRLAAATRQVSSSTAVIGVREMLTSLGLLCLLSIFMALLGLVFLLKMTPPPDAIHFQDQVRLVGTPEEATNVYEVALALCSLGMTLDVCCCLVCATQLILAARLVSASTCTTSNSSRERIKKFLSGSASSRICAIAGFFVSIPVFLTDIVLYTILQFPSTPAISTSIVISVGILLCGCAMLHNLVVWQKHSKRSRSTSTNSDSLESHKSGHHLPSNVHHYSNVILSPSHHQLPTATLDLSALNSNVSGSLELSTLV